MRNNLLLKVKGDINKATVFFLAQILLLLVTVNAWGQSPSPPQVGQITQPTCVEPTGSVYLYGLPENGVWTINPGEISGSGTDYTVTGLAAGGTYNFTVTDSENNTSLASDDVIIDQIPTPPSAPSVTVVDNCNGTSTLSTSAAGSLLWSTGETSSAITVSIAGTYTVTTTVDGCVSPAGSGTASPKATPSAPSVTVVDNCNGTSTLSASAAGNLLWSTGETSSAITVSIAGTYTVTTTVDGCVSPAGSGVVLPDPLITGNPVSPAPVCVGESIPVISVTATGGIAPLLYQWYSNNVNSVNGGIIIPGAVGNSFAPPSSIAGVTYYYCVVKESAPGCASATSTTALVTVNAVPSATISGTASVCKGASSPEVTFTGESGVPPYTFTYTVNGGSNRTVSTTSDSNTASVMVPTSTATTFTYTLVRVRDASTSACSQPQTGNAVVTVNPLPVASINGTTSVCAGSASPLVTFTGSSGTPPYTFTYSLNSGTPLTITTENGNSSVSISVPTDDYGIFTYSLLSISDSSPDLCSQAASGSATVTVNQLPSAPLAGSITSPTCTFPTGSVRLTGLPLTGTWTLIRMPGNVETSGSGSSVTISGLSSGTYTFTVTNSKGCVSSSSEEIIIPVQPGLPTVLITNPAPVCSPLTVDLTLPVVTSGSTPELIYTYWTDESASRPYLTPSSATTGTYYIKGTNSSGCFDIKPVIVTVVQSPVANAGAGGNECDLTFTFNALPSVGTGTWTLVSGPGTALFSPNANTANAIVTVSVYGTYIFRWTETNGICSNSSVITVNFYEQPVAGAGSGGNNCGLEFFLDGQKNLGTGTWTKESGPGTVSFSPDANTGNAIVTVSSFGTYAFRWTVVNGTCSASALVSVRFIQQPAADAGNGGDECDLSFTFNAVQTPANTGTWKMISGPGNAIFTPTINDPAATVTVDEYGLYSFSWTESNIICKSTDNINVTFHSLPVVSAGDDTNICKGSSVQLQASGTGSFRWEPDSLLNKPDIFNPVASPDTSVVFRVYLTDKYGCSNTDDVSVYVWQNPVADAGKDTIIEYQFKTFLTASKGLNETGNWSVVSGSGVFSDAEDPSTEVTGLSLNKNEFKWTVTNGVCPEASDIVQIMVKDLTVPTMITPNGDNKNEYLFFHSLDYMGKTELFVFDRNGMNVFKSKDYKNDWNGVDNSGNELPEDTYFYILKAESGKSFSSYVVIRR